MYVYMCVCVYVCMCVCVYVTYNGIVPVPADGGLSVSLCTTTQTQLVTNLTVRVLRAAQEACGGLEC